MNGRYLRELVSVEGVVEACDNFESVREKGRTITRFLLAGDERTYYFYSEIGELQNGTKVKIYLANFDVERATVRQIDFLDKNHKLEVLK